MNHGEEKMVERIKDEPKKEVEWGFPSTLLRGDYNEEESARSFQEALRQWRREKSDGVEEPMTEDTIGTPSRPGELHRRGRTHTDIFVHTVAQPGSKKQDDLLVRKTIVQLEEPGLILLLASIHSPLNLNVTSIFDENIKVMSPVFYVHIILLLASLSFHPLCFPLHFSFSSQNITNSCLSPWVDPFTLHIVISLISGIKILISGT